MRIAEILTTQPLRESITGITVEGLGIDKLLKRADQALEDPAATAIDQFVGMMPNAKEQGVEFGIMQRRKLEDAYSPTPSAQGRIIRQQLDAAVRPIKLKLKQKFGDTMVLYRAQEPISGSKEPRHTLSWTSDYNAAAYFAGVHRWFLTLKPITDDEIRTALETYHSQGFLKWRGKRYVRTDSPTDNPNADEYYYDILDKDGDHITDGDNIEHDLRSVQKGIDDAISNRDAKLKRIISARIPIDNIIWITDRAGQSEFILHNVPGGTGYIGPAGNVVKSV